MIGVVSGANQPLVYIAANGSASLARGTVRVGMDSSGKVVTTVTDVLLP